MPLDRLNILPDTDDIYSWADYLEIRALVHPDKSFSRGELATLFKQLESAGHKVPDANEKWRETKEFIRNRSLVFGAAYPITIAGRDEDVFELPIVPFNAEEKLYLTLLLCSNLRYVRRADGHIQALARLFEECSLEVFKRLMPGGSEVFPAWAGPGAPARYTGTLPKKLREIGKDIRATPNFDDRDFATGDRGDGGIDMVAWHGMGDDRVAIPSALAQCGCSREEWRTKHVAASPAMLRSKLNPNHPWATYYFMPLDLRWSDGNWAYKSDFGDAIIVDRLRMVTLSRQYGIFANMPLHTYIDDAAALDIS